MRITIFQSDVMKGKNKSPFEDAVCIAFKRAFPNSEIIVFSRSITIDGTVYLISDKYPQLKEFILSLHTNAPRQIPLLIDWDESTIGQASV